MAAQPAARSHATAHATAHTAAHTTAPASAPTSASAHATGTIPPATTAYLYLLNWCFAIFSSTRLLTYLPTMWAIHSSGDSNQHSLLTWFAWVGSNASMAAWLFEQNGRRFNKAIAVTCGNTLMCAGTCVLILIYR